MRIPYYTLGYPKPIPKRMHRIKTSVQAYPRLLRPTLRYRWHYFPMAATVRPGHPEPPDPEDSGTNANTNPETDPSLHKYHYIDPGTIHYQRASLEQLFHNLTIPLTGYELRRIAEGRRLKLSVENASVILLVFSYTWEDATDDTWNSFAELLSDWAAEKIVRETLPVLLSCSETLPDSPIKIPLRVRHNPPDSTLTPPDV